MRRFRAPPPALLRSPLARASSGDKICHLTPGRPHLGDPIWGAHRSLSSSGPLTHSVILGRHVREALANGEPVVALESTVITHGLPEPQNLELALQLEEEISQGHWWPSTGSSSSSSAGSPMRGRVTPATVGIVRGQLVVGLSRDQIEFLARKDLSRPIKASRRDIPLAQACKLSAGTTVSATMALATSCRDIAVFATGGLGGVHLGGERSWDVSADLHEMARSPMGLVSSGFKSFLDTRRSLELLETLGCTVASLRAFEHTYTAHASASGQALADSGADGALAKTCHPFPGFFTTTCEEQVTSPWQCASVQEAARILFHCLGPNGATGDNSALPNALRNPRAMLLACPIPRKFSLDQGERGEESGQGGGYSRALLEEISAEIEGRPGLGGKEKTPLILAELSRRTGGRTLGANLELLRNNARIGAHLAHEYALLRQQGACANDVGGREGGVASPPASAAQEAPAADNKTAEAHAPPSPPPREQAGQDSARKLEEEEEARTRPSARTGAPIVIGCTMIDMHVRTKIDDKFKANPHYSGVTFDGEPRLTLGGVGRNLAKGIELLGHKPLFITSLARDNLGQFARDEMLKPGGDSPGFSGQFEILEHEGGSSCFALVLIDSLTGQCEYVIANLEAARTISRENLAKICQLEQSQLIGRHTPLVVLDANLPGATVDYVLGICHSQQVPVFVEPTDVACLPRLVDNLAAIGRDVSRRERLSSLAFLSPNVIELREMVRLFRMHGQRQQQQHSECDNNINYKNSDSSWLHEIELLAEELMSRHLPRLACLLVTMDKRGLLVGVRGACSDKQTAAGMLGQIRPLMMGDVNNKQDSTTQELELKYFPPLELIAKPVSGSGAGDCFASGFISGLLTGGPLDACVTKGFRASLCALRDESTVPESLRELSGRAVS